MKLFYRVRLVEQPPPLRRKTFDSFDHSLCNALLECFNSGATDEGAKALRPYVKPSDNFSFIVFKTLSLKSRLLRNEIKKGRACTRPFKSNLLIRCQYIRGQRIEEYFAKQPEGYRPTFYPTCDPVRDRKSISGLH